MWRGRWLTCRHGTPPHRHFQKPVHAAPWVPFSWRYAFLVYSLLLVLVASARPLVFSKMKVRLDFLAAAAAVVWFSICLAPVAFHSELAERRYSEAGRDVAHT